MRKMDNEKFDDLLAGALKRQARATEPDRAAVERVLKRLSGPLPRQRLPFWRLPAVLLDWQFAPAWPRVAELAGCLALGFAIGLSGLDRNVNPFNSPSATASSAGFGSLMFEPEALTGARP